MMTPEQFVAILGAIGALIVAVGGLIAQLAAYRRQVNGRLTELLRATSEKERKIGELEGRDFIHRLQHGREFPHDGDRENPDGK